MAQWERAGLITLRSLVRVQLPVSVMLLTLNTATLLFPLVAQRKSTVKHRLLLIYSFYCFGNGMWYA